MYSRADFYVYNRYSSREEKEEKNMEYLTGVKPKETKEISELLEQTEAGTKVKVNGAVHTIRDMGTIVFIILRKREGLVQCVYEENISKFDLKDVKEADTVEVTGVLTESAKAPNGIEIRLGELKILSEPAEPMPLPIAKWKLNTSLEAKLNYRPISLRNIRERAKFRIQEGTMLQHLFEEKIANIAHLLQEVEPYEKERIEKIKGRIIDALNKIDNFDYDKNRFEQEMIFYIEKLDINEEKHRLDNHLKYFLETLQSGKGQGKKLGFISQEMGREINTLGSKSNHAEMQRIVVRMKDELEQIKEQVLNVM